MHKLLWRIIEYMIMAIAKWAQKARFSYQVCLHIVDSISVGSLSHGTWSRNTTGLQVHGYLVCKQWVHYCKCTGCFLHPCGIIIRRHWINGVHHAPFRGTTYHKIHAAVYKWLSNNNHKDICYCTELNRKAVVLILLVQFRNLNAKGVEAMQTPPKSGYFGAFPSSSASLIFAIEMFCVI